MGNELLVRTLSAIVLGAVALTVTWIGGFAFRLFVVVVSLLVFFEWFRMVQTRMLSAAIWAVGAATMFAVSAALLFGASAIALPLVLSGAVVTALIRWWEGLDFWPAAGIVYASVFGVCLVGLREQGAQAVIVLFLFAVIWCTDIFAFFGGRSIGGPKLAPHISPRKTWSGFVSGLAGGLIAGMATVAIVGEPNPVWIMVMSLVLSVAGQLGDLFESAVKRRYNVKDSGDLIPGHGGVMDRVDSIIFAAFAAYVIQLAAPAGSLIRRSDGGVVNRLLDSPVMMS